LAAYVEHLAEVHYGKATIDRCRYNLENFYNALPAGKRVDHSTLAAWREQLLEKGLASRTVNLRINVVNGFLNYLNLRDFQLIGGLMFQDDEPLHRSYVNAELRRLCTEAQVPDEKGNPRCLRKLYFKTQREIEENVRAQVEQTYDRMLEQEQRTVGWNT